MVPGFSAGNRGGVGGLQPPNGLVRATAGGFGGGSPPRVLRGKGHTGKVGARRA